jgi:uncharacterized protein (TIGR02597 family)
MPKKIIYFLAGIALVTSPISADAQNSVATIPEGMITFNIPKGATSYLSLPLTNNLTYTGVVSAVTSNNITVADSPAPWTAGGLATASAPYFVKFLTGSETGRTLLITSNIGSSLTLNVTDASSQTVNLTTSGFSVAAGDTFEVFPADTLASVFGDNSAQNPLVLQGSTKVFTADSVSIYNPSLMRWQAFYFNTTSACWQLNGSTVSANNTILYPFAALAITRRVNEADASFVLTGRVTEVSPLIKTTGNNAVVYNSTGSAADMTLSQIQFGSNWTTGTSAMTADTVSVWDAALNRFDTYYQTSDSTWRKSGNASTDQSNLVVAAGSAIAVLQRSTVSGEASFLSSAMPYSLE